MPRYIDADEVLETMRSNMDMQELYLPIHFIDFVIEDMPTADVEPVRHGRWVEKPTSVYCSNCRTHWSREFVISLRKTYKFCPNCGARMDGDAE